MISVRPFVRFHKNPLPQLIRDQSHFLSVRSTSFLLYTSRMQIFSPPITDSATPQDARVAPITIGGS